MDTVRWGIIGCGDVTEVKSGPALQYAEGSRLVAVMRRNRELAEDYARRHGVPRWYGDAASLIGDAEVDAVYVASPPGNHLESALAVCAAGKPAYVEKPLARNHDETLKIADAFRSAGLPLFAAYYRRALPRFLKVRELLTTGKIGMLTSVSYRQTTSDHRTMKADALPWRVQAEHSGGGLFLDVGSHTLDLLDFLVGPLREVHGLAVNRASEYRVEDGVAMEFLTEEGAPGTASWNFAGGALEDRLELTGTDGRISCTVFGTEPVVVATRRGDDAFPFKNPYHIQQPLIQEVVNSLRGTATCSSTGESAARTALVMDTVLSEYYGGRGDAFWSRPETWEHGTRPAPGR
ncbi:MAG TPA: Gfo/Idh/MocA family oxidoreductase [Spirochaetia bacterium]|nr:Gfo/Idh/MocA family oxidoreductase [Spirochaetia bacterium]